MAHVRYFAAAEEAAGCAAEDVPGATLDALLTALGSGRDARFAAVLDRCSLLLDGRAVRDPATPVGPDARLDVLPPFAGG